MSIVSAFTVCKYICQCFNFVKRKEIVQNRGSSVCVSAWARDRRNRTATPELAEF